MPITTFRTGVHDVFWFFNPFCRTIDLLKSYLYITWSRHRNRILVGLGCHSEWTIINSPSTSYSVQRVMTLTWNHSSGTMTKKVLQIFFSYLSISNVWYLRHKHTVGRKRSQHSSIWHWSPRACKPFHCRVMIFADHSRYSFLPYSNIYDIHNQLRCE